VRNKIKLLTLSYYIIVNNFFFYIIVVIKLNLLHEIENKRNYIKNHQTIILHDRNKQQIKILKISKNDKMCVLKAI